MNSLIEAKLPSNPIRVIMLLFEPGLGKRQQKSGSDASPQRRLLSCIIIITEHALISPTGPRKDVNIYTSGLAYRTKREFCLDVNHVQQLDLTRPHPCPHPRPRTLARYFTTDDLTIHDPFFPQ